MGTEVLSHFGIAEDVGKKSKTKNKRREKCKKKLTLTFSLFAIFLCNQGYIYGFPSLFC